MSRKILFSDFDGTLFINGKVSDADREAIHRWRKAGNLFAMASGRYMTPLKEHLKSENVEWDFLLCLNGAEAFDCNDNQLFEVPIDIELLPKLFYAIVQDNGWANVCYGTRGERIRTENCTDYNKDHMHYSEDRLSTFTRFTQICSAARDKSTEGALEIKKRVLDQYSDYVSAEVNGWSIDINEKSVNKASGIAKLIEIVGVDPDCVYAVGDNFNDLSMLTAYRGCVVAHAPEAVRLKVGTTAQSVAELIDRIMSEDREVIRYGKLVRDLIPERIRNEGFVPGVRTLDDEEYLSELYRKLREETEEYLRDETPEEIADILEVLEAICAAKGFSMTDVQQIKENKLKERGGFERKLYLIDKKDCEEKNMKVAVTYANGEIFQHFGHTEQFKIYEIEDKKVLRTRILLTEGEGHGALANLLAENNVDILICGGIGGGAQMALLQAGVRLFGGVCGNADDAVNTYLAGKLVYNPNARCTNHEHGHDHVCGSHGCGSHTCH